MRKKGNFVSNRLLSEKMTDIYNCRFLVMVRESGADSLSQVDIESAYDEFRRDLIAIADSSESYSSIFRQLTDLRIRLQLLSSLCAAGRRLKKKCAYSFLSETGSQQHRIGTAVARTSYIRSRIIHGSDRNAIAAALVAPPDRSFRIVDLFG